MTIKSILETDNEIDSNNHFFEKLSYELKKEINNSFASFSQNGILMNDFDSIEKLLKRDYYLLLLNIKIATFSTKEIKINNDNDGKKSLIVNNIKIYEGGFSGDNFDGSGVLYTFDGLKNSKELFLKENLFQGCLKNIMGQTKIMLCTKLIIKKIKKLMGFL